MPAKVGDASHRIAGMPSAGQMQFALKREATPTPRERMERALQMQRSANNPTELARQLSLTTPLRGRRIRFAAMRLSNEAMMFVGRGGGTR